jgi:hypothetical protein
VRPPTRLPAALLGLPAARLGAAVAAGVLAVSVLAGAIRALPILLAPGVPLGLAPVLGRAVIGVGLETALFVAPPIAWAVASARLVERGEARALFAAGVGPLRIAASTWPMALGVALAAGLAAAAWGREAAAPGRIVRDLLASARSACVEAAPPAAADVPGVGLGWVCLPGEAPRVVGLAPVPGANEGEAPLISAAAIAVSDDLRALRATDLALSIPAPAGADPGAIGEVRLRAGEATLRGLPLAGLGRASNLGPAERAALIAISAAALAGLAAAIVLRRGIQGRVRSLALGAAGPAAALLAFANLERGPAPPIAYLLVPFAGAAAIAVASRLPARRR